MCTLPRLAALCLQPRSVALFHLDEFEAAKAAFEQAQQLDPSGSQYQRWVRKCQAELDGGCAVQQQPCLQASLSQHELGRQAATNNLRREVIRTAAHDQVMQACSHLGPVMHLHLPTVLALAVRSTCMHLAICITSPGLGCLSPALPDLMACDFRPPCALFPRMAQERRPHLHPQQQQHPNLHRQQHPRSPTAQEQQRQGQLQRQGQRRDLLLVGVSRWRLLQCLSIRASTGKEEGGGGKDGGKGGIGRGGRVEGAEDKMVRG